jgi:hypothetical protein
MEFGDIIEKPQLVGSDLNTKYVGFSDYNLCIKKYFSQETIDSISKQVTKLLQGVDPQNRPIIVTDRQIGYVMDNIYANYRPPTSDIYGRYNVPTGSTVESYVQDMIDQAIQVIYSNVKNTLEMAENNSKLSAWTTVLGEGLNEHNLRSFAPIKTRVRRPNPMEFHMKY